MYIFKYVYLLCFGAGMCFFFDGDGTEMGVGGKDGGYLGF